MMYDWDEEEGEEEEDEGGARWQEATGKNVILFLVEGTGPMQARDPEDGKTLYQKAVEAACATMQHKVFRSDRDLIGVLTFGTTNKVPDSLDLSHMCLTAPLDRPNIESIVGLERLLGPDGTQIFEAECGSGGRVAIHEVLWYSQSLFAAVKGKVASKRILLLTCNPVPHPGDTKLDLQARRKAADLHATGIYLEVVPVTLPGTDFNFDLFYRDIIRLADDDWKGNVTDIRHLTEVVLKKTYVKRTTSRLKFELGNGLELGVATYNLLGRATKPAKTMRAKTDNEEVKVQRTWVQPVSGAPLLPSDMAKYMSYGGKNIKMTEDEVAIIRSFGDAENKLKLVGFRPLSTLKLGHHVKLPQFLYPCESLVKGSVALFATLLLRCHERQVAAVCSMKQRSVSKPSFVALVAQPEQLDEAGLQVKPPGFHVIHLPFLDDFRQLPDTRLNKDNPPEAVEAAKAVVSKLKLKHFAPVENPVLQSTYRMIEAYALHRESLEPVEDETLPDLERMRNRLKDRSSDFINAVYDKDYDPSAPVKKKNSAAAGKQRGSGATAETATDMAAHVRNKTVDKLTVDVLKAWLKEAGIPVAKKKKADLVEDVMRQF